MLVLRQMALQLCFVFSILTLGDRVLHNEKSSNTRASRRTRNVPAATQRHNSTNDLCMKGTGCVHSLHCLLRFMVQALRVSAMPALALWSHMAWSASLVSSWSAFLPYAECLLVTCHYHYDRFNLAVHPDMHIYFANLYTRMQ